MTEESDQRPPKPGTACIGCRRRKLKCSREPDGCTNCLRSDLPCVYPAPQSGIKRKRGPYRKDKPARERHLEDLVRYLEPRVARGDVPASTDFGEIHSDGSHHTSGDQSPSQIARPESAHRGPASGKGKPDDLVKDALIALTKSSAVGKEAFSYSQAAAANSSVREVGEPGGFGQQPSVAVVFDYWHIFVTRFDPLTKVIHCPTFGHKLCENIGDLNSLPTSTQTLLFGIYYAAVTACTPKEVRRRFGQDREELLERYGRTIEATLADNYGMPELESLQALVIYMVSIRRQDNATNTRALFSLAVRMSQLMRINEDPGGQYRPLEAELRRRLWWHLAGLENRGAEEGGARKTSIMEDSSVQLPANLFDYDLQEDLEELPKARRGTASTTFFLLRCSVFKLIRALVLLRKKHEAAYGTDCDDELVKTKQRQVLEETRQMMQREYLHNMDESRPYDWLCLNFIRTMLVKARLIIDHPLNRKPTRDMSEDERIDLLKASVEIIAFSHSMTCCDRAGIEQWAWYLRTWVQWHSLAIVISELGRSSDSQFSSDAWAVLDPFLSRWDKMFALKQGEAAWDHVNTLIKRAREVRRLQEEEERRRRLRAETLEGAAHVLRRDVSTVDTQQPATASDEPTTLYSQPLYDSSMHAQDAILNPLPPNAQLAEQTGCTPVMEGLDVDFSSGLDTGLLDDINFSAFNFVFADTSWAFPPTDTDWSTEGMML